MFRLYAMTFLGKFRGTHEQEHHLHESPAAMTIPLMVLAILLLLAVLLVFRKCLQKMHIGWSSF